MSSWIVMETVLCCIALALKRKIGFIGYQVLIASAYLVVLCFELTLDYTMSVYFVFAVLPYIRYLRFSGPLETLLAAYLLIASAISVFMNGIVPVASALVIHYFGPLLLLFVFSNIPIGDLFPEGVNDSSQRHKYIERILIAAMIAEALIGAIALGISSDGRLMLNYQCVSGCISCIIICFVAYQLNGSYHLPFSTFSMGYCLFWAFISGTRGYIILAFAMALVAIAVQPTSRAKIALICCVGLVVCIVLLANTEIIERLFTDSRMGASTGRRTYENQWFLNIFSSQGLLKDLFGIGLGTTYLTQEGAVSAFAGTGVDAYAFNVILHNTALHNFWYMMTLSIGLLGSALYLTTFIAFFKSVSNKFANTREIKILLLVFMLTYAFVLWFRWTATGGVLESAVLCTLLALYQTGFSINEHGSFVNADVI